MKAKWCEDFAGKLLWKNVREEKMLLVKGKEKSQMSGTKYSDI
jgi:hypothetical protein